MPSGNEGLYRRYLLTGTRGPVLLDDFRHPVVDLRGDDILERVIGDVEQIASLAALDDGDEIEWARERFSERHPQVDRSLDRRASW